MSDDDPRPALDEVKRCFAELCHLMKTAIDEAMHLTLSIGSNA